jgi:hypothetical protein
MMRSRWLRLGDWLSQGWNVLRHNGKPDESTSGRAYREGVLEGNPKWLKRMKRIDRLFHRWEVEHCKNAYFADLQRAKHYVARHKIYGAD